MEQIISKEELDELMKIEGEVRGLTLKGYTNFILKEEGKEGLKRLEDAITELGYPIKHREIKAMSFYPVGLDNLLLLSIKKLFNYDNKKFQEIGEFQAKSPLIIRLFVKYFISLEKAIEAAPKMWKVYYSNGDLKVTDFNKEKKYAILRLENFHNTPIHCQTEKAYFSSVARIIVGSKVTCEETKCTFRGDDYHEFLLRW
ncbi:MAG: hypothetical protein ACKKMR_03590 [Candidatus Nealsonbacteria bacterium]